MMQNIWTKPIVFKGETKKYIINSEARISSSINKIFKKLRGVTDSNGTNIRNIICIFFEISW